MGSQAAAAGPKRPPRPPTNDQYLKAASEELGPSASKASASTSAAPAAKDEMLEPWREIVNSDPERAQQMYLDAAAASGGEITNVVYRTWLLKQPASVTEPAGDPPVDGDEDMHVFAAFGDEFVTGPAGDPPAGRLRRAALWR